jgi:hypothetical protein
VSLFDSLFTIPHRHAAHKIKEYALSLETSELERAFAQMVEVELYRYVAERTYLLPALARLILYNRAIESGGDQMRAASGSLERMLDEYFATRPGVDANVSTYRWHLARDDYHLDTPDSLAGRFLVRLTEARLDPTRVRDVPRFLELVNSHVQRTAEVVVHSTKALK